MSAFWCQARHHGGSTISGKDVEGLRRILVMKLSHLPVFLILGTTALWGQTAVSVVVTTNSPISVPANEVWHLMSAESSSNTILSPYELYTPDLRIQIGPAIFFYAVAPTKGWSAATTSGGVFVGQGLVQTWVWSGDDGYLPVSGPATISVVASSGFAGSPTALLTYKKFSTTETNNSISATSVVIPTTATGDVDVKLEQTADNISWTECLPGTHNSSTVKRFFRVRAVEK